jgi:DNA-binding transcriptional LysR family regulator
MKLDELTCFLEVARQGNMTTAAKVLNLAQSTVSERISQLEEFLGTPLFERLARERRLELTAAGKRLRSIATKLADFTDDVRAQARASRSRSAPARLGVNESVAHLWLGSWLARLRVEQPELAFDLKVGTTDELDAMMVGGALDLAIGTRGFGYRAIVRRELAQLPMVFVGSAEHHDQREYSLAELAKQGLVTFQPRSLVQQALHELLRAEGLDGCRIDTVSSVPVMLRLVEDGGGIATLPRLLVEQGNNPRLRILRCRAALDPVPLWLSWRGKHPQRQLPTVVASILAFFEQTAADGAERSYRRGVPSKS